MVNCLFPWYVKALRTVTADYTIPVVSLWASILTMVADAEQVTVSTGCSKWEQYCFDDHGQDCYDCKTVLNNANKYWLMMIDPKSARNFYASLIFPLLYAVLLFLSPEFKIKQTYTLQDWYDREDYWHSGKVSRVRFYQLILLIISIIAIVIGVASALFPHLVIQSITYPSFQILITLYGSFPNSRAIYAVSSLTRTRRNQEEDSRHAELRRKVGSYELKNVIISFSDMLFTPTHVLLEIGEASALNSFSAAEAGEAVKGVKTVDGGIGCELALPV
jgi:hypothetical protein